MPWYITREGYSGMHDQTARGEYCASICEQDECIENCEECPVYDDTNKLHNQ